MEFALPVKVGSVDGLLILQSLAYFDLDSDEFVTLEEQVCPGVVSFFTVVVSELKLPVTVTGAGYAEPSLSQSTMKDVWP